MATAPNPRPTRVRYLVLALTTMVAVLLYVDRICLSFLARYVQEDLSISQTEMGFVLSSFFITYALGQLPAGWFSDRFGARLMLGLYLAVWSLFTGLLGLAHSILILVALRLGCGLFEAGGYPAAAGIVRNWMPFNRRGLASGIVSVGGRLGGAVAPLLSAYLLVLFVPVSSSSLLEPADIFDIVFAFRGHYSAGIAESDEPGVRYRLPRIIYSHLSKENKKKVESAIRSTIPLEYSFPFDGKFRAEVTEAINLSLETPDFLHGSDLSTYNLPAEAVRLLQPSATPLTPEEIQRRNRLVLETVFPNAIRKIYSKGWRPVMVVYGIVGVLVACVFWMFFRNSPRGHPGCNAAEIVLIEGDEGVHASSAPPGLPIAYMVKSYGLWISSVVQFLTNIGWAFLITWLPSYLGDTYHVPPLTLGLMASLPIFVGMAGMFWGGWLTDHMTRRVGLRWGRAAPLALTRFVVAGAFLACIFLGSAWEVTIAMAMVSLATDLGTPAIWAYSMDVGGKHVGSVLGWSNMFGNFGAALSPILLAFIRTNSGDWAMFAVCASAFFLAGVLSLFLDAGKPVVPA
jgi:MFS transporter, ACS family, glucarate transporter